MLNKILSSLVHVVMLAIVIAVAAYWGVRVLTPQPTAAPPPVAAPVPREPDPVLAARMFGLVEQAATRAASNIQVAGLFGAGKDSSAVLVVDGKPPRVFVLGQEVAPGTTLVEVTQESAVIESAGGRQELRAPPRPAASLATGAPAPAFAREGNTLVLAGQGGGFSSPSVPVTAPMPQSGSQAFPPGRQPAVPPAPGLVPDNYVPGQPIPQPPRPPSSMQPGVPLRQGQPPGVPQDAVPAVPGPPPAQPAAPSQ